MNDVPFGLKTTPLYPIFKKLEANFTEFGGYYMPVHFKQGIVFEHQAIRNNSGLFDVSHMGEIRIKGKDASDFLNYVSTNNIKKIGDQQIQYHIFCNEDGGVIDDMLAYKFNSEDLWLVCNASNQGAVYDHLVKVLKEKKFDAEVINEGDDFSVISVQGPESLEMLEKVFGEIDLKYMTFNKINDFILSRSGYTGEDGYEVYGTHDEIYKVTENLLELGVAACGLGARDTLRFEAGLPLFGHELSPYISPVEAGLNFAIDLEKEEFIGKKALVEIKENPEKKVVGLVLLDRGVARQGYSVYDGDKMIGYVTSGFMIPGTKNTYANALIDAKYKMGDIIQIEIRNKRVNARIRSKRYIIKK